MNLTTDQLNAIVAGEPVPLLVDRTRCVLIREDMFERLKRVTSDALDAATTYELMEEVMAEDDANDPALESYQKYKR